MEGRRDGGREKEGRKEEGNEKEGGGGDTKWRGTD